ARIAPSSTRENHSPGAAPVALKFYDMGPKIFVGYEFANTEESFSLSGLLGLSNHRVTIIEPIKET
ncbi:MAG: hypothetical protein NC343_03265, partial [Muribaculum sp.]|nr:hypothetical protein [Muribaculaceae bacterium]MCM1080747.1 hypothetical protein [Muribaculum sp.]